jgi:hypothetical protein
MAGPVPAIHVLLCERKTWMPAPSAGMTSELLGRSLRSSSSYREIRAKEVDKCHPDGYGKQYVALLQDHAFILP